LCNFTLSIVAENVLTTYVKIEGRWVFYEHKLYIMQALFLQLKQKNKEKKEKKQNQ